MRAVDRASAGVAGFGEYRSAGAALEHVRNALHLRADQRIQYRSSAMPLTCCTTGGPCGCRSSRRSPSGVHVQPDGSGTVNVLSSKTDQDGRGHVRRPPTLDAVNAGCRRPDSTPGRCSAGSAGVRWWAPSPWTCAASGRSSPSAPPPAAPHRLSMNVAYRGKGFLYVLLSRRRTSITTTVFLASTGTYNILHTPDLTRYTSSVIFFVFGGRGVAPNANMSVAIDCLYRRSTLSRCRLA